MVRAVVILVALIAATLVGLPASLAQPVDVLRSAAEESRERFETAELAFEAARADYEALVGSIEAQKDDVLASPLRAIELQASLRRALASSETVAALDERMRSARREMRDDLVALHDALHAELDTLGAALDAASPATRSAIGDEVQRLVAELDTIESPLAAFEPVPLDDILADLEESSDALRAAADELADNEDRLDRHLDSIREELARIEAREALRERATRMAVEDRFFDDGMARRPERPTGPSMSHDGASNSGGGQRSDSDFDEASAPLPDDADSLAEGGDVGGGGGGGEDMGAESSGGAGDWPPGPDSVDEVETDTGGGIVDVPVVTWDTEVLAPSSGSAPGVDPTLLDRIDEAVGTDDRRGRRGRSRALEALEAEVQDELRRLRAERERVEAEAEALEEAGF